MGQITPEEARLRNIEAMGEELGSLYTAIRQETIMLCYRWKEYKALFGHSKERVDLLNMRTGSFFKMTQDIMWEYIILHIAKLTDSEKTAGHANLSIRRLPAIMKGNDIGDDVKLMVDQILKNAEFAREWRNKKIAHTDLHSAINGYAKNLTGINRKQVDESINDICDVLNKISGKFLESETAFSEIVTVADGETLLYLIDDGIRMEKERKRLRAHPDSVPEFMKIRRL